LSAGPSTTYRDKDECEHVLDRRLTNSKNKQIVVNFYKQAQCHMLYKHW